MYNSLGLSRWDIVEGYCAYYLHYHGGRKSQEYRRLSKILTYFSPGPLWSERQISRGAREVYESLQERNGRDTVYNSLGLSRRDIIRPRERTHE